MADIQQLLATCEQAAKAGAEQLMQWRGRFATREKQARDLVTDADLASQKAINEVILSQFPDHGFLGEEDPNPDQLNLPYCWVADPLDGTTNYVHDFPCFCVSVAVAHEGQLVAGVVFDPLRNECFSAGKGQGSQLNGQPVQVGTTSQIDQALVAISFPPTPQEDAPDVIAFRKVAPLCQAVRRTGSAALNLAYVACGRLDAHWAHYIHPWDSAAGVLLVEEAGGTVTSSKGDAYNLAAGNYFAAATPSLHQSLLPLIN